MSPVAIHPSESVGAVALHDASLPPAPPPVFDRVHGPRRLLALAAHTPNMGLNVFGILARSAAVSWRENSCHPPVVVRMTEGPRGPAARCGVLKHKQGEVAVRSTMVARQCERGSASHSGAPQCETV